MKRKLSLKTAILILVGTILFTTLTGCKPAAPTDVPVPTPVSLPMLSVLNLPDGSQIVLKSFSEIKTGPGDTLIKSGEILVVSLLPSGSWFTVVNPRGFIGHVTADPNKPGAIMLVTYDDVTGKFTVVCIQGICELGPDAGHLASIPYSSEGSLDLTGQLSGPAPIDLAPIIAIYGKYIQAGLFAPTAVVSTRHQHHRQNRLPAHQILEQPQQLLVLISIQNLP